MSTIDTVDLVAAAAVAMLEACTKQNADDGYEATEERLFSLVVNLVARYSRMTQTEETFLSSVNLTLQAIEENFGFVGH